MTQTVIAKPTHEQDATDFNPSLRGRVQARNMVSRARKALDNQQKLDKELAVILLKVSEGDLPYVKWYVARYGGDEARTLAWIEGERRFAILPESRT